MADSPSDAELIRASLTLPEKFAEVFERRWEAIFCFFERRLGTEQAADLASEVFRIAFERRESYEAAERETSASLPWLYGIAANLALKERRRFARHMAAVERLRTRTTPDEGDHAGAVAARVDSETVWSHLQDALTGLDDTIREMLLLVAWEGLSYQEVADAFDVPIGTVRSRIHRARNTLRTHLDFTTGWNSDVSIADKEKRHDR